MKKQKMLNNSEISSFCKQTAWILKAGITPAEGMEILINDTISKEGKELLQQIRMICNKGNHFYGIGINRCVSTICSEADCSWRRIRKS